MTQSTNNNANDTNYFDMPDDDILGMSAPTPAPVAETPAAEENQQVEAPDSTNSAAPDEVEAGEGEGENEAPSPLSAADDEPPAAKAPVAAQPPAEEPADGAVKSEAENTTPFTDTTTDTAADKAADKAEVPEAKAEPTAEDYKALYDMLLSAPIKANGKQIQLRSPEEVKQAVQMGLNYTKKMQALQPRLRVVTMLENNGLLDEAKLAHLIDISKGDHGAIQKLLADSKFDPLSADADQAASYRPGNHQVSDAEMAFNAVLDDLESTETGPELILELAKQWDEQSRQVAYRDPAVLKVINEQKANGLYAHITNELTRLQALGRIPAGTPFLQAYKAVGDMLNDQGLLVQPSAKQPQIQTPVETRVAKPAPQVINSDKAKAASPTKSTPTTAKTEQNLLDLPDDEFIKQMQGRL